MKVQINIDVATLVLGVGIGLVLAPFVYDNKTVKGKARKGAVKEVTKSFFHRKEKDYVEKES